MENEAPRYAQWIPTAGGYVANGNVVSRTPLYDNGKLRTEVDTLEFGNTNPQTSVSQQNIKNIINAQSPETQSLLTNDGITAANTEGSNKDANSLMTGAGSLASLNNNTENTEYGPTNTPATHSNIAGDIPGTPLEEAQKRLQQYIATNNIQGQINELTTISNITGQDYSAEIQSLTKQRQQKIENIDNDYSQRISTAMMVGDVETANALRQEQAAWRNSVGYQDAMAQKYQTAQDELIQDYEYTYLAGVKDIGNMLMQALPGILNFQYDPMQDMALQNAQAQVELRMRNNMSATGMYYSSTTQYAIAQAIGELVPVYQKMAREEAIENFKLLQQTANFLMDLEQSQFDLWKGQLDVKFKENADKRAEVEAAWDRVNQMGYVDNETSAILGIPAGTESYATRKAMTDKINKIDEEERNLLQKKALERYTTDLAIEKAEAQAQLDNWKNAQDDYRGYLYSSQLKQEQFGYDQALKSQQFQNDYYLQLLKNAQKTSGSTQNRDLLTTLGATDEAITDLDKLSSEDLTPTEKQEILKKNLTDVPSNATEEDKEIVGAKNKLYVDTYLQEGTYKNIDQLLYGKLGSEAKTTTQALEDATAAADEEAKLLASVDIEKTSANIADIYNHILDKVEDANAFDTSTLNINDDYTKMKDKAAQDIIKKIKANEDLGEYASDIAEAVEAHWDKIHNSSKESRRDDLINNTTKEIGDRAQDVGNAISTGINAVGGAVNTALGTLENAGVDATGTASNIAGLLVGSGLTPGMPYGVPNGTESLMLGKMAAKSLMDNIAKRIKSKK